MAFVKLDCGMLDSTLWLDRCARELFITALLMAQPYELENPVTQIEVNSLALTDFEVPPGWYGFVPAAGVGIVRRSGMDHEQGMKALERLGEPDNESRTPRFDGRRMVRVEGGFIILNYDIYRQKDHTAAERAKNYRARKSTGIDALIQKQHGRCACCGNEFEAPYQKYVVQDHCHKTKKNRALVCQGCNRIVGLIENRQAISDPIARKMGEDYLIRHGVTLRDRSVTKRNVTQAEEEAKGISIGGTEAQPPLPASDFQAPTVEEAVAYAAKGSTVPISAECAVAWHDDRSRASWCYRKGDSMFPITGDWRADLRTFARSWESIRNERAARNGANGHAATPTPAKSKIPPAPPGWQALYAIDRERPYVPVDHATDQWANLWRHDNETARAIVARANAKAS